MISEILSHGKHLSVREEDDLLEIDSSPPPIMGSTMIIVSGSIPILPIL
jgi:hypothetical protein